MRVVLLGAQGQLGQALRLLCPQGITLLPYGREDLDVTNAAACAHAMHSAQPDWVINAAAYTAVDQAEKEVEQAYAVNASAPANLCEALHGSEARFLQISTDFVFDGRQSFPYGVNQSPTPLGVYGASKAQGELPVLAFQGGHVLRTSWLYSAVGRNFCLTMLRLHRERAAIDEPLSVVVDQVGVPTSAHSVATACWHLVQRSSGQPAPAILHWTDAGVASWFDFAVAIGELALELRLLDQTATVVPIHASDYPVAAKRPQFSVLDCRSSREALQCSPQHWRASLRQTLLGLAPTHVDSSCR